ncbi:MAG: aminotransferase class V-fold PLP-dependent enzyme [Thaumarchaeota archaeon]|nr:aminotransferase class V-fold PLP-dependent enzyme [Nitrososphaerota archaeon]
MHSFQELRREFPIASRCAYLNNAATSPVSRRVVKAVSRFYGERMNLAEAAWDRWVQATDDVRKLAAGLLNVNPDEIAVLKNTSEGLNAVALGRRWRRVVTTDLEFPSNLYPWLKLREKGVDVRVVKHRPDGTIDVDAIRREAGRKEDCLVAVSHVQYGNGFKIDLDALRESVGEGCMICVDAVQSMGVISVDARRIDFLSSGGHKWLLSPFGVSVFYVRRDAVLDPPYVGWASVQDAEAFRPELCLADSARRFEIGCIDFASVYGLRAALQMIQEIGLERIEKRARSLLSIVEEGADRMGLKTMTPRDEEKRGSIINIKVKNAKTVVEHLAKEKIMVVERLGGIRVSPHFYNNEEDIERFLGTLKHLVK